MAPTGTSRPWQGRMLATAGLVMAIGALAVVTALVLFGIGGIVVLGVGLLVSSQSYRSLNPRTVLRALGARPLHPMEAPQLFDTVAVLAARAGLRRPPALALLPEPSLNAFATGSGDNAVVAVTPTLLRTLTPRQLVGVLAHEISHVHAADLRVMGLASTLARFTQTVSLAGTFLLLLAGPAAFAGLSTGVLLAILWSPTLATLLLLALSRSREHTADADAVELTGDPEGLAQALWVLDQHTGAMWEQLNPGRAMPPALLRTHPTTESRLQRLRHIASHSQPTSHSQPADPPLLGGSAGLTRL